ncbi:MAG: DUF1489 domain-containing protein [Rhodospirillales bacterium]|nr:DUF1489 domain-containing protein [Rhodospirillales bacterium]
MTIHLIKLSVGVEDVEHLARIQAGRLKDALNSGEKPELKHITRNTPRRAAQVLDGGSIYWVIKGFIRARQAIIDIRPIDRTEGRPACGLVLEAKLIRTELRKFRPFQGWRYFPVEKAPPDAGGSKASGKDVPEDMAAELRNLGLL